MATTRPWHLLVLDDDSLVADSLKLILPKNWRITAIQNPSLAAAKYKADAALVDMHFKTGRDKPEGPFAIENLLKYNPSIEVVAMSGDQSLELMELCLKKGATRFLSKPLIADEVISILEKIEASLQLKNKDFQNVSAQWVGSSLASQNYLSQIASLRGEPGPILIQGATGTGKEVSFELLHQQEPKPRPKVTVNVAALSENLFESELFGHTKGAFTGADQLKVGLAEAAHGGDLFLDEIEALSLANQVKLLRFLESGEVRRVGSKESLHCQVRVIAASNEDLKLMVKSGQFREDLYFRLSGKTLFIPSLGERKDDIAELSDHFLKMEKPRRNKTLSPDAIELLINYNWPGNVRELKRIIEQASLRSPLPLIRKEDLLGLLGATHSTPTEVIDFTLGLQSLMSDYEKHLLMQALKMDSDIDRTAQLLKISRSSLYKKLKDYQIEVRS